MSPSSSLVVLRGGKDVAALHFDGGKLPAVLDHYPAHALAQRRPDSNAHEANRTTLCHANRVRHPSGLTDQTFGFSQEKQPPHRKGSRACGRG